MNRSAINRHNVGRIAERIVANELEYRGFRVSDLNKDGTSMNADLIAAKDGKICQLQVKGATDDDGPWFNYGFCDDAIIAGEKRMFNAASSFYKAQFVVLVSVKSPIKYTCLVLPVDKAEQAAQLSLNHSFRVLNRNGSRKRPGRVFVSLNYIPRPRDASRLPLLKAEQEFISPFVDNWDLISPLGGRDASTAGQQS